MSDTRLAVTPTHAAVPGTKLYAIYIASVFRPSRTVDFARPPHINIEFDVQSNHGNARICVSVRHTAILLHNIQAKPSISDARCTAYTPPRLNTKIIYRCCQCNYEVRRYYHDSPTAENQPPVVLHCPRNECNHRRCWHCGYEPLRLVALCWSCTCYQMVWRMDAGNDDVPACTSWHCRKRAFDAACVHKWMIETGWDQGVCGIEGYCWVEGCTTCSGKNLEDLEKGRMKLKMRRW